MDDRARYRFGPFEFRADTGELRSEGRTVRLEPQPARLLALLLSRPGELVPRDELRRALWDDGVHVDVERGLAYALSQVRTALGDSAAEPRFVETLPRRGVRFLAPVDGAEPAGGRPAGREVAASRRRLVAVGAAAAIAAAVAWLVAERAWAPPPRVLLAVSAFDNETGRAEHDALTARMADAVVARLLAADLPGVGVIGNEAVLRRPRGERDLPTIRRETGADHVVLGQLQLDPAGLRVIAHLIALDDGTHVWAERFVRPPAEADRLEGEVAAAVAAAVASHLAEPRAGAGDRP